jgi:hypothetical protein
MHGVPNRGQASAEYVAILLVVGTILAAGATHAGAVPGVGGRVVDAVRTGLCIVGGDVCRSADARAAGLEPCVTRERSERQDTTVDIAVLRLGEHGEWQLALQSDGRAVVTRLEDDEVGGAAGVGLTFSPAGLEASATATLVARFHGGRSWRFADGSEAAGFVNAAMHDASVHARRAPDVHWQALGGRAEGAAEVDVANLAGADLTVAAGSAIGLRRDGARRTLTLDLGVDDPRLAADLPGLQATPGTSRAWVAELSWEHGDLRELALRSATSGHGRLEEYGARLDLRDPGNRAVAERLVRPGADAPANLAALIARIRSHGVVERDGYVVAERRRGFGIAAKLGIALGLEHERISSERRLVDAVAWIRGGPPRRRFDCLGV